MIPTRWFLALAAVSLSLPTFGQENASTPPSAERHTIDQLEVRILSTMLAERGIGEWGFAALVAVDGEQILFDTGARERTVLDNARELGIDLSTVETVVLSHNHLDHTGGLLTLRDQLRAENPKALSRVYVAPGIFRARRAPNGTVNDRMADVRAAFEEGGGKVEVVEKPTEILPGVWLTGPVPRVHPERNWSSVGQVQDPDGAWIEDTIPEDLTLVVRTDKGLVHVFGCGHAGVVNTLEHTRKEIDPAPVRAIVGGLHLFRASDDHLKWTAEQLRRFEVHELIGAHCTGLEAVYRLRDLANMDRDRCVVGAVGASYSLAEGIRPGALAR